MTAKRSAMAAIAAVQIAFAATASWPASATEDDPVAATVDGHVIHLSNVEQARSLLPPQLQAQPMELIYEILLDSLVNSRLAASKARDLGLHEQPEYKERMARIGEQILERMLLTQYIEQRVTEDRLAQRYARIKEEAAGQQEIHARHILVKAEDVANALIEKLDDGDDFADLAREYSIGPSGEQGGDLGWFGPGEMVPAFEEAAMALEPGSYSDKPVQTQFGWHVIFVEEERPIAVPDFMQMRPALVNELSAELGQKLMTDLRGDAKIKTNAWQDIQPGATTE